MGHELDSFRSDQSQPSASENSLKLRLEAGLDALKRRDYAGAIAHFEAVYQGDSRPSWRLKAQVGLVKAYEKQGDVERAIALCEPLTVAATASVREWAVQTLETLSHSVQLAGSAPPEVATGIDATGFVPLSEVPGSAWPDAIAGTDSAEETEMMLVDRPATDATGFVPLEPVQPEPPLEARSPSDPTGFTPLSSTPSASPEPSPTEDPPTQPLSPADEPTEPLDPTPTSGSLTWAYERNVKAAASNRSPADEEDLQNPFLLPMDSSADRILDDLPDASSHPSPEAGISPAAIADEDAAVALDSVVANPVVLPLKPRSQTPFSSIDQMPWRNAPRAQRWSAIPMSQRFLFWLSQATTAIALIVVTKLVLQAIVTLGIWLLKPFTWFLDLPRWELWYDRPLWVVIPLLVGLLAASPWVLDFLWRRFYGMKVLTLDQLAEFSPEASRTLKRVCGQRRRPVPTLRILPTPLPVALSYGGLPRTARIAISQGLVKHLTDDEIAVICAGELGHIVNWDVALMSLLAVVTQIPYLLYRLVAEESDRQSNRIIQGLTGTVAAIAYTAFWTLRWTGLWLSKSRIRQGDWLATNATGNPNGLARALLKMAIATTSEIQRRGQTDYLLESVEMLTPIGYRSALSIGSLFPAVASGPDGAQASGQGLSDLLRWDVQNPHRRWLTMNNTHPRLGDRLQNLMAYARHWRLEPEVAIPRAHQPVQSRSLILEGAPYFSALLGVGFATILMIVGQIARRLGMYSLSWLWSDRLSVMLGCLALAVSFGIFLRINRFFPDIKPSNTRVDPALPDWFAEPERVPLDSQPIQLQGKLMGRKGVANWLNQDLTLETETGLIRLHVLSHLGPLGNLIVQPRPQDFIGRPVVITGWFRRGATPWIDVDSIRTQKGYPIRAGHPIWSTLLGAIAALWGAYTIYQGGF